MSKVFTGAGWVSGPHRALGASVVVVPPPPPLSLRTMLSGAELAQALWGTQPVPDTLFNDSAGNNYLTVTTGYIDKATTAGACFGSRVTGGNSVLRDANGRFSPALWKAKWDTFVAAIRAGLGGTGEAKVRAAVAAGTWRYILVLDDFTSSSGDNSFTAPVTYLEMEDICAHAKADWPWMPLMARGPLDRMKSMATLNGVVRQYAYLDAGWAQYAPALFGDPVVWFAGQVQSGLDCSLAALGGANLLDQGRGTTPGWGCQPGATIPGRCPMSPTEILAAGFAALDNPALVGFSLWSYSFGTTYWLRSEIQAAMQSVYNKAATMGRIDGPINVRNDLTPP